MTDMPVACVIGWPVKHSRSPVIHRFWLKELGIAGDYVIHPVEPENVAAFFAGLPESQFVGCNVTVPHKEAAFAAVAKRDRAAEETGALNTIWLEDGRLVGGNTDPVGFLANLDAEAPGWDGIPWDRSLRPSLDEVLAVRRRRQDVVSEVMATLDDERLAATVTRTEPGWPSAEGLPVSECLSIVLIEEWEHRGFAERDLGALGAPGAPGA